MMIDGGNSARALSEKEIEQINQDYKIMKETACSPVSRTQNKNIQQ